MRPEHYATRPTCPCGGLLVADKWMNERDTRAMKCGCDGYHFEHRIGSLKCNNNPDGSSRYGDLIEMPGIRIDEF